MPAMARTVPATARNVIGSRNTTHPIGRRKRGVRLISVDATPSGARSMATRDNHTPAIGPASAPRTVRAEASRLWIHI